MWLRRDVMKSGLLFAAPPVLSAGFESRSRYAHRLELEAVGTIDPSSVIAPSPIPPAPSGARYRVRFAFPFGGRDVLDTTVTVEPIASPGTILAVISHLRVAIRAIELSDTPAPSLAMSGVVNEMVVPSPFGDVIGRTFAFGAGFTEGVNAVFTMVGGTVAGSHATFAQQGSGRLLVQRPWHSL